MNDFVPQLLQDPREIEALAQLFQKEGVRSYLEVGAKFGGSLFYIGTRIKPFSKIVAVDLPGGTREWKRSEASLKSCINKLTALGHYTRIVWGDSTSDDVIRQVRSLGPFDAVFIDANHTTTFIERDFKNYGPLARLVAFHDIAWRRADDWGEGIRIDVPQFWDRIKLEYPHQEFRFCPTGKNNGIGVIWRS